MKRLIVIAAALLALTAMSAVTATASSASVCQPNGTGCTKAGWYDNFPVQIYDSGGLLIDWTQTYVYPYSSGVPLYWYVGVEYNNIGNTIIYLHCPPASSVPSIAEIMTGGNGNDGYVAAERDTCSDNPNWVASLAPGRSVMTYAIFHNVPWPGTAVSIVWGQYGTDAYPIYPFDNPA